MQNLWTVQNSVTYSANNSANSDGQGGPSYPPRESEASSALLDAQTHMAVDHLENVLSISWWWGNDYTVVLMENPWEF